MLTKPPIYLDYMATTPIDPRVRAKMVVWLDNETNFGNAASEHYYGYRAREAIALAREEVASLINALAEEIVWTSGATEANNLAIKGAANFYQRQGKHLITSSIEHKAVLDCFRYLETQGFKVSYIAPEKNGIVSNEKILQAIQADTVLVSLHHVNNEIGTIQNIEALGALLKPRGIIFHVDAAQSAGKIPINVQTLPADLISFSAHKIYGPKGIGALFVRKTPRIHLVPQIHGGGQEQNLRSGTLPTHQIIGMGEAFRLAKLNLVAENEYILKLREKLWQGIFAIYEEVGGGVSKMRRTPHRRNLKGEWYIQLNGDEKARVSGNLNISFGGVNGEMLYSNLNQELAISSAAACMVSSATPSHVLKALGVDRQLAQSSLRISLGRFTTDAEIERAIAVIRDVIRRITS